MLLSIFILQTFYQVSLEQKQIWQGGGNTMKDRLTPGTTAPDFTFDTPWKPSLTFFDFLKEEKALLMFLRYMGCPLCQMKIAEMIRDSGRFKDACTQIFIVLQSQPEIIKQSTVEEALPITIICDPDIRIFNLYKVHSGTLFGYIAPGVIKKAIQAKKQGYTHGKKEGKELQLPAVFLIDTNRTISYAYYGKHIDDIPDNTSLLSTIKNIKGDNP